MPDQQESPYWHLEDVLAVDGDLDEDGPTLLIDESVMIADFGPSLAKGLATIWGLGDMLGPHVFISHVFEDKPTAESLMDVWETVGRDIWTALPPREALARPNEQ